MTQRNFTRTEYARLAAGAVLMHTADTFRRVRRFQQRRPVLFLLLATTALLVVLPLRDSDNTGPVVHAEGPTGTSRYVHWMTENLTADRAEAERLGCETAKQDPAGTLLLAFGRQVQDAGTRGFDGPGALRSYEQIATVTRAYRDGLERCGKRPMTLVVATSNYRIEGAEEGARYGLQWASMIKQIENSDRVTVLGGTDLEPGWGSPQGARAWVEAYRGTGLILVSNASADGCPRNGDGGPCANGWNTALLADLVWGGNGFALPQIYRHDGAQAEQWGVLARVAQRSDLTPRFLGAMTQVRACDQVRNRNCPQLSLGPDRARRQLEKHVGDIAEIPVGTDVGWG